MLKMAAESTRKEAVAVSLCPTIDNPSAAVEQTAKIAYRICSGGFMLDFAGDTSKGG